FVSAVIVLKCLSYSRFVRFVRQITNRKALWNPSILNLKEMDREEKDSVARKNSSFCPTCGALLFKHR
ncbi:MAG TPA: hypothetical protein VIC84_10310, partial [Blastocatellia bacterium]